MEPTSSSDTPPSFNLLSPTLRRVLDALLDGQAIAPQDQAALTEADWAELKAMARTAHLTRLTLHQPEPDPTTEAAALARAQRVLAELGPRAAAHPEKGGSSWLERLKRFLGIEDNTD